MSVRSLLRDIVREQRPQRRPVQTDEQRAAALHLVLQAGRALGAVSTDPAVTTLATAAAALEHAASCAAQCETHFGDATAADTIRAAIHRLAEQLRARYEALGLALPPDLGDL